MKRHYFVKEGSSPVWIHVPGTPFTLPGERQRYSRLPGMKEWAPREVVERMGKGLSEDTPIDELVQYEENKGLPGSVAKGGVGGSIAGILAGRLSGGEQVSAPIRDIFKRGISKETLRGLSKVPTRAKVLPLAGLGIGAGVGAGLWGQGKEERGAEAKDVAKGLLSEQILQQHSMGQARKSLGQPVLPRIPLESASMPSPKAVVLGTTGV